VQRRGPPVRGDRKRCLAWAAAEAAPAWASAEAAQVAVLAAVQAAAVLRRVGRSQMWLLRTSLTYNSSLLKISQRWRVRVVDHQDS